MNVDEVIQELHSQKEKLEHAIVLLEELAVSRRGTLSFTASVEKRGRKSMGAAERRQVSQRMKRYWAARRKRREA